ncbi:MAG: alpha/beta hydrolase [Burkholderiaceae bacterium]|jgi:fermentation-respiration switch protein FrsA (DUF1100 family)|nr:alpha/beta hydrolase [Burkholderiaceae bacterium]
MKFLRASAIVVAVIFLAGFLIHASGCADKAFYYPTKTVYSTPDQAGISYEAVAFKSADGTRLTGWFMRAKAVADSRQAKGTVIHFHGNAENMTSHWQFAGWLTARGFNVFVFDYRGYGASEGTPSPAGCFEDSNAAIDYVRSRPDVDPARLLVFGQSLGGNHAIAAVGAGNRAGIRALAEESTFFSYPSIANDKIPGAGLLIDDHYSAKNYIAAIAPIPLLIIHGTSDEIVPYSHATRLFAAAREPKQLITVEGGGHIEAMMRKESLYRDALAKFFEDALEK